MYRIKNWEQHFETHETRKLKKLLWIKLTNSQDNLSFKLIAKEKDAADIFAAWVLMLQVASKQDDRGILPLSPGELGIITGFPERIFKRAIDFLKSPKIGWIEQISHDPPEDRENPPEDRENPPIDRREGREGKDWKDPPKPPKGVEVPREILSNWKEWERTRKKKAGDRQLKKLMKLAGGNLDTANQILEQSIENQWIGIFEMKKGGQSGRVQPTKPTFSKYPKVN